MATGTTRSALHFSNLLRLLAPVQDSDAAPNRVGLQRLMLLRGFVTAIGLIGLALLQPFSSIDVPLNAIALLSCAVAASLVFGYWRLRRGASIAPLELLGHLLVR